MKLQQLNQKDISENYRKDRKHMQMLCRGCGCSGPGCCEPSHTCRWPWIPATSAWDLLLPPGGPDGPGDPKTLAASVRCRWRSESKRATWERLEVGLGVGQHLSARSFSSLSSLRFLSNNKLPSSSLGLFPHGRGSPLDGRSLSLPFFACVFSHLLVEAANQICAVHVSTHVGKFLLNFPAVCFLLKQFSLTLHDVFLM